MSRNPILIASITGSSKFITLLPIFLSLISLQLSISLKKKAWRENVTNKPVFKPNINGRQNIQKNLGFLNSFKTHVRSTRRLTSDTTHSTQNYL